ncbi:MAG: BNR repeat-containing protein [Dysgonamonadaceae bacterium]|jgi:hypothetical protein|nr:BNR repeat-containing protein [Dysgonamonadaceae bacterium]
MRFFFLLIGTFIVSVFNRSAQPVAQTPPMRCDQWDCYGLTVREYEVKANANMANGYASWAGNSINTVIFRKNSLVSHGDVQFMAYYDVDSYLCLGKRNLNEEQWEIRRTPYAGNIRDAHNCISIMTDGEGYLHVAWNHHNSTLNYTKSKRPLSLDLEEKQGMTGVLENHVTYPEFHQTPDGNLLFLYREGGSGSGNLVVNRYNTKSKQWKQLHNNLIDGEKLRNAYWQACIDKKGVVHLSWVWRETPDVATNHDMCYARSCDNGETWESSEGEKYQLPIAAATAEYACKIPQNSELINQTSMTTDDKGNPCIATYYCLPDSKIPQYHLIYRNQSQQWKDVALDFRKTAFSLRGTGTKKIPIARPQVFYNERTKQWLLVFRDEERGNKVSLAICGDLIENQWRINDITSYSVGDWEPTYDTELWKEKNKLHLFVQKVQQGDGEQNSELEAQPISIAEIANR